MSSLLYDDEIGTQAVSIYPESDLFLRQRLQVMEELWEKVLLQECGQKMVDLLRQLRDLCSPEGHATNENAASVFKLIEQLDINESIRASRAFALYFQLINIIEQDYEQRQQMTRYEVEPETNQHYSHKKIAFGNPDLAIASHDNKANFLAKNGHSNTPSEDKGTFASLFPKLFKLNVPPQHIQRLIDQLDVRLVFTAHPTEIVRHTIRGKQRRVVQLLQQLDALNNRSGYGGVNAWEVEEIQSLLLEDIRLWWRTDELHQFKPSVLDEVDYALHYFQEVIFDGIPQLYRRLTQTLQTSFPWLEPPQKNFCKFGSWVGGDRDGNPSVTPEITWETACYQRHIVLGKYIQSLKSLRELLSVSMHWSDVLPDLLESLELDQSQLSEVYDELALRYRQEPYRLKLSYILKRLENTCDRNEIRQRGEVIKEESREFYQSSDDFLAELRLIQRNLTETGLTCQSLENLICQVEIFGFHLTQLDIRQESSRHSDALSEILEYLGVLDRPYNELNEDERIAWLVSELQTRRPLIPSELPLAIAPMM